MKVFMDMDGVLTDFDGAVKKLNAAAGLGDKATPPQKQKMYDAIDEAGESFWSEMEWLPEGKKLWSVVKKYNPVLLSSPGQFLHAVPGKKKWIDKNLPGVTLIPSTSKYEYAERDAVLIDDMYKNIEPWRDQGGIGILFKDVDQVKKELQQMKSAVTVSTIADVLRHAGYKISSFRLP